MSDKSWKKQTEQNSYIMLCDYCGHRFRNKELLTNHLRIHIDKINKFACCLCEAKFLNKKLLSRHKAQKHPKRKKIKGTRNKLKHICVACHKGYADIILLKYHIRKKHFNLVSHIPYCNNKEINQVWFEKVLNTNFLVEVKKIGNNHLLLRRLSATTSIKATEMEREVFDVRMSYPTASSMDMVQCRVCLMMFTKKKLKIHFVEMHGHLLKKKCDSCKSALRSVKQCIHHICPDKAVK